jgi:hypothetical protein
MQYVTGGAQRRHMSRRPSPIIDRRQHTGSRDLHGPVDYLHL